MQQLAPYVFAFYFVLIAAGAIGAVAARNLVRALLGLIVAMFGVSGMYLLLNAPFVAMMQIFIYIGAVAILIFFALMLTRAPAGGEEREAAPMRKHLGALIAALGAASALGWVIVYHTPDSHGTPPEILTAELGRGLMEDYVLAFELISVVLFVAMSAAVLLAFSRRKPRGGE
jgi:NADH-quinone oxidoreductase subunit J